MQCVIITTLNCFILWVRISGISMKRTFDLLFSITALIMLAPLLVILSFAIFYKLGYPIIFKQTRPGEKAKPFEMFKFRTMTNDLDDNGLLLSDSARLTKFGNFIRASSLDELPELWNVIRGEMSLVGPRPLLMEYVPLYDGEQFRRHDVLPGITGWAQVNGRNAISWEDKFKLDVWYVDNQSFWLDVKILLMTVKKVFFSEGIRAEGEVTMARFTGKTHR